MKKKVIIITGIMLCVCSYLIIAGENINYMIVVHVTNPVNSLSKKELSKLFLKKVEKWDNGYEVHPVDLNEDSPIRNEFTEDIHQKELTKIIAYWKKEFFKNQTIAPPQMDSEQDVITYIESDSGAVGYISTSIPIVDYNVKVLTIEK